MPQKISQLHNHTDQGSNLRMLDVCVKTTDLIDYAASLNTYGIALTEHESLSSHIKAIQHTKARRDKGLYSPKLILGNEIYLIDSLESVKDNYKSGETKFFHAILLAKDKEGHHQLRQLSSKAWGENYFRTGLAERVPTIKNDVEAIVKSDPGHLIFQTACIGGELPYHILKEAWDKCYEFISWGKALFGEDFYLEIQPGKSEEQIRVNKILCHLGEETDTKIIVTCDTHYLKESDKNLHLTFINSREDGDQERGEFYESCWLHTPDQIHEILDEQIGKEAVERAILTTNEITDKISEYDLYHTQVVPKLPVPNFTMEHSFEPVYGRCEYIKKFAYSDNIMDRYFLYLIENGWWEKEYKESLTRDEIAAMMDRINIELEAVWVSSEKIHDNVASYYIVATDLVNMMWDTNSLVGTSRGSAGAFYIGYLIGMHQVNSMRYNIPYWRHLHPSRPEMPDVDIDSCASKRGAIIEATRQKFGEDKVLNICTFKTEGARSALLTCCRSMGIDPDMAQYLSSLIPTVRGATTPLKVMVNGDAENDILPNTQFINECGKFEGLLDRALSIEGLVSGRSIHASGVIIFDSLYTEYNAMMRAPNGQPTTQYDMNDSSYTGGLKFDFLTISNLDAIQKCIELLLKYGYIEDKGGLRATYEFYFHPDKLDYSSPKMWEMIGNHEIVNLFQFMTAVGGQAIAKIKPKNLNELFTANAIMRLMAPGDEEQPIDRYVRYKQDPSLWYDCMREKYHLTEEEIKVVEPYLSDFAGMSTMQETVMSLSMDKHIAGFDMLASNKLRKSIAKKNKGLQEKAKHNFFDNGRANGASDNLLNYVWHECIAPQLGYSFSLPHIVGYSLIALLEANLAFKFPIEFWNCANLTTMSMAGEGLEGTVDYGAVGIAIADMQQQGISISNPDINRSEMGFEPDIEKHQILYGLKTIAGVGDTSVEAILTERKKAPFTSLEDFCTRLVITKQISNSTIIAMIKAGCFETVDDLNRTNTLHKYLKTYLFEPNTQLTAANMSRIQGFDIVPEEYKLQLRIYNFKTYVFSPSFFYKNAVNLEKKIPKCGYHDRLFKLNNISQPFFQENFSDESIEDVAGQFYLISEKRFIKEWTEKVSGLIAWLKSSETLKAYNNASYEEIWNKYGAGTISKWDMQTLSCYNHSHELTNVNLARYGVKNYFDLPAQPLSYSGYYKMVDKEKIYIPKFNIVRIAGTVLNADNNHHTVSILTLQGTVNVKFNKGQYAFYNRRISAIDPSTVNKKTTKKNVIDDSWFKRGNLLLISGYRQDDTFRAYRYKDTVYLHTVYKIVEVEKDGSLKLQSERAKVDINGFEQQD